jgi:hypothetical protein
LNASKILVSILMLSWLCIIVYQYNETNVTHFLFNLLRIKGLNMFRALLTHPQEALHKPHLVYFVRVISVGCTSSAPILVQPTDITRYVQNTTIYKNYCIYWNILFNILPKAFNIMKFYWQIFYILIGYLML